MDEEILAANRKYRRVILVALLVCVCFGMVLLQWVLPWTTRYLTEREPQEALRVLQTVTCLLFLSVLPLAWYIWSLGRKVVDSQQMPPPGVRLIKDVKVVKGAAAVARGRVLMALAVVLALAGLAGGIYLPWMLGKVMSHTASDQESPPETSGALHPAVLRRVGTAHHVASAASPQSADGSS
jgi:hypothetical protein